MILSIKKGNRKVKKILILVFSMALFLTMAACGERAVNADENGENASPSASATVPGTLTSPPTKEPADTTADSSAGTDKPDALLDDMYHAYADALENLIQNHIFPNGAEVSELLDDMAQNKFALCDVDNDGKEELLLMYTTASMAGMTGYVFAYDTETNKLQTELREFPLLTFYDNGIIKAGWSHNQGLAGENFWPYNLYQYVPETDSYVLVGMVDAWDKSYPGAADQNNPFPSDIDKSGTGFVYYIMRDGQYDTTHPQDASEYNAWINSYIENASEIQIQYMDLTEENIAQIGEVN